MMSSSPGHTAQPSGLQHQVMIRLLIQYSIPARSLPSRWPVACVKNRSSCNVWCALIFKYCFVLIQSTGMAGLNFGIFRVVFPSVTHPNKKMQQISCLFSLSEKYVDCGPKRRQIKSGWNLFLWCTTERQGSLAMKWQLRCIKVSTATYELLHLHSRYSKKSDYSSWVGSVTLAVSRALCCWTSKRFRPQLGSISACSVDSFISCYPFPACILLKCKSWSQRRYLAYFNPFPFCFLLTLILHHWHNCTSFPKTF